MIPTSNRPTHGGATGPSEFAVPFCINSSSPFLSLAHVVTLFWLHFYQRMLRVLALSLPAILASTTVPNVAATSVPSTTDAPDTTAVPEELTTAAPDEFAPVQSGAARSGSPSVARPTVTIPKLKFQPIYRIDDTPRGSTIMTPFNFAVDPSGVLRVLEEDQVGAALLRVRVVRGLPSPTTVAPTTSTTTTLTPTSTSVTAGARRLGRPPLHDSHTAKRPRRTLP